MQRPLTKERKPEVLYIIGCEGINQEKLYFNRLQDLINNTMPRTCNVKFDYAEPYGGNALCVVQRVVKKSIGKSNKAAIFDHDSMASKYEEAIDLAYDNSIEYGYSNFCFDLWLLLHKTSNPPTVLNQDGYSSYIKSAYSLPATANIKRKEHVDTILSQINLQDIINAIHNAEILDATNSIKSPNYTSQNTIKYYNNPDTRVHTVLKSIFNKCGININ